MWSKSGPSGRARGAGFSQILQRKSPDLPGPAADLHHAVKRAVMTSAPKRGYAIRPQLHPKVLMDRYKEGGSHPVSTLYDLAAVLQRPLELRETVTPGNTFGLFFAFCALVDGVVYRTGVGSTKKEARMRAAELALRDLLPQLERELSPGPAPLPVWEPWRDPQLQTCRPVPGLQPSRALPDHNNPQTELMSQAVQQKLAVLLKKQPELSACTASVAAFLLQSSAGCEVVALGTGSINTNRRSAADGRVLHDAHALVVARRSLMRFLYRHLLMFFNKKASLQQESIFQETPGSPLLAMRSDITLHLYLNQLPKGAAQMTPDLRLNPLSIAAWEVINQLSLHLVVEGKVFSVSSMEPAARETGSMSSTDKLTQWQVLGYQGALLSLLTQPLYAHSILIGAGGCRSPRPLALAVSQRAEGVSAGLPLHYCMQRPHFSLAPAACPPAPCSTQQHLSLNWSQGDSTLEVVDGLEGRTMEESPFKSSPAMASRLCKAAMLTRFQLVVSEAKRTALAPGTYREAKRRARSYQEAKTLLKTHLSTKGYGVWPSKPPLSDSFHM